MTISDKFVKFGSPQTGNLARFGNRAAEPLREWNGSFYVISTPWNLNSATLLLLTAPH